MTSPLVDLVTAGTLSDESLARALEHSSNRPRLRWNMLSRFSLDEVYERCRSICAQFQCLPLRVEPDEYVEVALVDPTWKAAVHGISEHFGLPVHAYVISYTDYLYLVQPALRPSAEDSLEFGETIDEAVSVEAIELVKRLLEEGGISAPATPSSSSEALPRDTWSAHGDAAEAASDAAGDGAAAGYAPVPPDADGARGEETAEVLAVPSHVRTPYSSPKLLEASEAFSASASEVGPTLRAIRELLDAVLEPPATEQSWRDVFDIFSMLGTVCVRGVRSDGEMYIGELWIDGVRASLLDWGHVGQMLYRVYPANSTPLSVLQLEPRHRSELDVTGYVGTNAVIMHHRFQPDGWTFFAVIGVSAAWVRKLDALGSELMQRDAFLTLLRFQRGPSSALVRVV